MNVCHANAHVALYLDVQDILSRLGHRAHSWCVSSHLWVSGHDVPIIAARAIGDWPAIDEAYCDRFAHEYGPHLSAFDAFIVDHPVCMAALFERTGRPVVVNATTRYDLGVAADPGRRAWLDVTLQRMFDRGQLIPLSNNRGDRAYGLEQLGFDWPSVPSLCEYPRIRYDGEIGEWLDCSRSHPPLPTPYAWQDLGRYRGIRHIPYTCSQMSVFEHYAASIPLVVPSRERLLAMAMAGEDDAMSQVSLRRVCGLPPGHGLDAYSSAECLERWIALSDWFDDEWMPHVVVLDDPTDPQRLAGIDTQGTSARMSEFNVRRRERILAVWRGVLDRAAASR